MTRACVAILEDEFGTMPDHLEFGASLQGEFAYTTAGLDIGHVEIAFEGREGRYSRRSELALNRFLSPCTQEPIPIVGSSRQDNDETMQSEGARTFRAPQSPQRVKLAP